MVSGLSMVSSSTLGERSRAPKPSLIAVTEVTRSLAFRWFWPVAKAEHHIAVRGRGWDARLPQEALVVPEKALRQFFRLVELGNEPLASRVEQPVVSQQQSATVQGKFVG